MHLGLHQQTVLMWVAKNRLLDAVASLLLAVCDIKSQGCFRNAIDLSNKIPTLVMGVWAAVVLGILFIGLYSWRTAEEARRMAEALAAAELVLAREQKLSALDGLAAAAAHGLGTPLATIAVVAKELLRDARHNDPHYEDLVLLRAQAERCRTILGELAGMKSPPASTSKGAV